MLMMLRFQLLVRGLRKEVAKMSHVLLTAPIKVQLSAGHLGSRANVKSRHTVCLNSSQYLAENYGCVNDSIAGMMYTISSNICGMWLEQGEHVTTCQLPCATNIQQLCCICAAQSSIRASHVIHEQR